MAVATEELDAAEGRARAAGRAVEEHARAITSLEERIARVGAAADELVAELAGLEHHHTEMSTRVGAEQARIEQLAAALPALEAAESSRAERARLESEARRALADHERRVAALQADVGARGAALDERHRSLTGRLAHLEERLTRHQDDRARRRAAPPRARRPRRGARRRGASAPPICRDASTRCSRSFDRLVASSPSAPVRCPDDSRRSAATAPGTRRS